MIIKVFDIETTGLAPPEAVVEIAYCALYWGAPEEQALSTVPDAVSSYRWNVVGDPHEWLVDPHRPITPQASAVHHIIDQDVVGAPDFETVCRTIFHPDSNNPATTFLAAHNNRFERQWLTDEVTGGLKWIDTYRCALHLWPDAPAHTNQALRYWLRPPDLQRSIADVSHRAWNDAYVTAHILKEMLRTTSGKQLVGWSRGPALLPRFTFGKHAMVPLRDIPLDYLEWILKQSDMDEDVTFTARHYLFDGLPRSGA